VASQSLIRAVGSERAKTVVAVCWVCDKVAIILPVHAVAAVDVGTVVCGCCRQCGESDDGVE
jgi:hypothetical protein